MLGVAYDIILDYYLIAGVSYCWLIASSGTNFLSWRTMTGFMSSHLYIFLVDCGSRLSLNIFSIYLSPSFIIFPFKSGRCLSSLVLISIDFFFPLLYVILGLVDIIVSLVLFNVSSDCLGLLSRVFD